MRACLRDWLLSYSETQAIRRLRGLRYGRRASLVLFAGLLWGAPPLARRAQAQPPAPSAEIVALVRAGDWNEAAEAATRRLTGLAVSPEERCLLWASKAYASAALWRTPDAAAALAAFDRNCMGVTVEPGVRAEMSRLRLELGGRADTAAALPSAMLDLDRLRRPGALSRERGTSLPPRALLSNADSFWRVGDRSSPTAQLALDGHSDFCARTAADACLIVRRGRIVGEWYRAGVPDSLAAMSSTKSVTALLVMMLLADGKLRSLDAPVCSFVASWCDPVRQRVTIRHLLTMTSGLPSMTRDSAVGVAENPNAFVTHLRPTAPPGESWAYSNEGVQLLSPILDRAAGEPIQSYAARRLFGPLGMRDTRFHVDAQGHAAVYANLLTTPRDLARLGVLVLQRGRWQGRQMVPAALIDSLVQPSQRMNPEYGMLWWRLRGRGSVAYVTRGYLATNMYVFPEQEVVVVRMQNLPVPGNPEAEYERGALPMFRSVIRAFAPAHWH